jgi:hypothetical protein
MLSIVHSNSKGSIIWFSIGQKNKETRRNRCSNRLGKKEIATSSPFFPPPPAMYGEAVRLAKTSKSAGSILPALLSRQITPSSQGVVTPKNPPSPSKGSRQGADASEPLLCSLPPTSDAIVAGDVEAPPVVARHRQQMRHRARRWTGSAGQWSLWRGAAHLESPVALSTAAWVLQCCVYHAWRAQPSSTSCTLQGRRQSWCTTGMTAAVLRLPCRSVFSFVAAMAE